MNNSFHFFYYKSVDEDGQEQLPNPDIEAFFFSLQNAHRKKIVDIVQQNNYDEKAVEVLVKETELSHEVAAQIVLWISKRTAVTKCS